jgi:hypothetical protein
MKNPEDLTQGLPCYVPLVPYPFLTSLSIGLFHTFTFTKNNLLGQLPDEVHLRVVDSRGIYTIVWASCKSRAVFKPV